MKPRLLFLAAALSTTLFSCQVNPNLDDAYIDETPMPINTMNYDSTILSHFISKDSANKMIQSYLNSVSVPGTIQDTNLYSLILDAQALRTYLSDTTIKGVKVMLAHTLDYINAGNEGTNAGYKSNALTIVIAGYDQNGNYVLGPGYRVPDRAVPCPVVCPLGTAGNSLLE